MNTTTRRFTAGIALLLIGLSLTTAVNLTAPHTVRAEPGVRYAAPTAQGSGDCSSWANACTLQTALAQAQSGDEIWVQAGVHYPTTDPNDRTATFTLKNGVAVYGGFAGTETLRDQRDWQANVTILSGDIDQNDVNNDGNYIAETWNDIVGDNAYHVVTGSGTNNTAVLDGFIITAGQANGSSWPAYYGGGMYNYGGSPTLTNVTFSGNSANYGGGMDNNNSSPALTNVTFSGNSAFDYGGGMHNYWYSNPALTNVIIWGNTAANGQSIYNDNSTPTIAYSDIQGCGGSGSWNPACGTNGGDNIDADPRFVDAANGNLRLDSGSPAIDTGTNAGCSTTDLDGLPRPTDGNGDGTVTCDMGAYEAGTMLCSAPYTFGDQSNVAVDITLPGNLACVYVDEIPINHPQATTTNLQTGRYWIIRGLQSDKATDASGFKVNLTLPTSFEPGLNDKVCRYTGSGWDCARSDSTSNSITRAEVTAFSDWTVGRNVGPTMVRVRKMQARPTVPWSVFGVLLAALALQRRRR